MAILTPRGHQYSFMTVHSCSELVILLIPADVFHGGNHVNINTLCKEWFLNSIRDQDI
jgi:hypothetical protein